MTDLESDERVLWRHEDERGALATLAVTRADRYRPGYELSVTSPDPEYLANELVVDLERAHLAELWVRLLEQADQLGWAREALEREAAIRTLTRAGHLSRRGAAELVDGEPE